MCPCTLSLAFWTPWSLFLSSIWVYARERLYVWLMTLFLQMLVFGEGSFSSAATITSFTFYSSFLISSFHSPLSSSHLSLSSFPQSFLVLCSQHLSGPLGPVLLMTYPETFKGTQEWNCGVTGINTKAAINKPLRCEIVKAPPNNDGEETRGDPGVTDQRVSFFVGWAGGICDKRASFCWSLSFCWCVFPKEDLKRQRMLSRCTWELKGCALESAATIDDIYVLSASSGDP